MLSRSFHILRHASGRVAVAPVHVVNAIFILAIAIFLSGSRLWPRPPESRLLCKSLLAPGKQYSSSQYLSNNDAVAVYFPEFKEDNLAIADTLSGWPVVHLSRQPAIGFESEVLATLQAAQDFARQGKNDKAEKLFEHASRMRPRHPEVLTQYGYFVEKKRGDIVAANLMYSLALYYNPDHTIAFLHQKRTQPIVEEADAEMLRILDTRRKLFLNIPSNNGALRRQMREAYFHHIYHTVAIEGNTMSLVQTRFLLETRLAVAGKSIIEHNEILGMDAAWRYVNQSLVNQFHLMTVDDILEIHRRVYGFVDPVEAGHFRRHQVYVGNFEPTAPENILTEMHELMAWLHSGVVRSVHPVEVAALFHYKFVIIHPFIDGNGRVSRLLMNLVLMQAGFPPVVIRLEDRLRYYETLETANQGDIRPFIRFIGQSTLRTLEEYVQRTTVDDVHSDDQHLVDDGRTILSEQ